MARCPNSTMPRFFKKGMLKSVLLIIVVLVTLVNISCSQDRTYLTEQEKAWNPYKGGQVLVFGTVDGHTDTLKITKVEEKRFPDGIGSLQNERLRVLVRVNNLTVSQQPIEVMFLYLFSKTDKDPSEISFEMPLAGGRFWGKPYPIAELEKLSELSLQTRGGDFDDIVRIEDNTNQLFRGEDIATIFWSKSAGYVKCIKKDGTVWELYSIR
jgi:hypothetical protein